MHLDIILRTHHNENKDYTRPDNINRICGTDRRTMMLKCMTSLVRAINACTSIPINLIILDDHSDELTIEYFKKILQHAKCHVDLVHLEVSGINLPCYEQLKRASQSTGLVYTLEDDYIHEENAINNLITAFYTLDNSLKQKIALYPFDCPFRYANPEPSLILYDGIRYWRSIKQTTFVIFSHSELFREFFHLFRQMSLGMPHVYEGETINQMYKDLVTNKGEVLAFCPIPSVAYHLAYTEPARILTNQLNWETLWNSIDIIEFDKN